MTDVATCELCAGPPAPGHNFCEGCGRDLRERPVGGRTPTDPSGPGRQGGDGPGEDAGRHWLSSTAPIGPCVHCGETSELDGGFCASCGRRRHVGQDHVEFTLGGVAAVTDKGRHKRRNEDAVAIGRVGDIAVAVVCDGVTTSVRADQASHAGVDTAIATLLAELDEGSEPAAATAAATRAAAAAVAALAGPDSVHSPPSCTYVSAVVTDTEVIVGCVGDSRAYWLADKPDESRQLTTDDSLAGQLAAAGVLQDDSDDKDPRLSALARWLGADAGDTEPRLTSFRPEGAGRVLLCSDGLHRYLSEAAALAVTAPGDPADTVRALNQLSLDAGGADNIAIVIMPFPPPAQEARS
jgi:serine/threonine protein phosphatase PrpC